MSEEQMVTAGRLIFQKEGNMVACYWNDKEMLGESLKLGEILLSLISDNGVMQSFIDTMQSGVSIVLREIGRNPQWNDPVPLPEHERAGRA